MQAYLGDERHYLVTREELLDRSASTDDRSIGDRAVKAYLLKPPAAKRIPTLRRLADQAVAPGDPPYIHYYLLSRGMLEYRCGNYDAAAEWLGRCRDKFHSVIASKSAAERGRFTFDEACASATYFLALAEHHRGHEQAARDALEAARQRFRQYVPAADSDSPKVGQEDWFVVHVVAREAETELGAREAGTRPSDRKAADMRERMSR
jgi:hypothetical protein